MTPRTTWILVAVLLAAGCKSGGGGGKGEALASRGDPLLGARIPPQNLPVSGKDSYTSREKRDPLLGFPSAPDKPRDEKVSKPVKDGTTSSLPRNTKDDPFRRGVGSTPAALAGHIEPDESGLSIGDRRPTVIPAGAVRDNGAAFDTIATELRKLGAKVGEPEREKGKFVVRCEVPIDADDPGR